MNGRDSSAVEREIIETRLKLRQALQTLKDNASRVAIRAEAHIADVRVGKLTFHGGTGEILALEARLVDLCKEKAGLE